MNKIYQKAPKCTIRTRIVTKCTQMYQKVHKCKQMYPNALNVSTVPSVQNVKNVKKMYQNVPKFTKMH